MKYKQLIELSSPYLDQNDFGTAHTIRVLKIVKENYDKYDLNPSWKDLIFSLIVLHDIGGSEIRDQYEKGPKIAEHLLKKLGFHPFDIKLINGFIAKHHERLENPHEMFKILFDSDKLVMFSKEEFPSYDRRPNFNWQNILSQFYNESLKLEAEELWSERKVENDKKKDNKD
jgi:hypothetical protein